MFRLLAIMLFVFAPVMSWAETASREFDAAGLNSLSVINTSGDITISVSTSGKALVNARKVRFPKGCSLVMERTGGKLSVETNESLWPGTSCLVHFDIKVPAAVSLDMKNGSGDVEVEGTSGPIEFKLGSGDVKVKGQVTDLDGSSGSGKIEVSGLIGNVKLKMGSGDIRLEYSSPPARGSVNIKNGSGDTTIILPESSVILTDLSTGSGKIYNEIGDTAGAPFKVTVTSGSGKLSIRKIK
jgi:DUF4097 and DUF4098 domain-containing protein YvlB